MRIGSFSKPVKLMKLLITVALTKGRLLIDSEHAKFQTEGTENAKPVAGTRIESTN